jgi:hypothetical protein
MARIATFSPASIDSLRQGRLEDPRTPGLMIEVLPSGRKVWKYERRLAGDGASSAIRYYVPFAPHR